MKIRTSKLLPNPFRHMERYSMEKEKITALINSIEETTFWDNLVVRECPERKGYYEIAYGDHRLEALFELKVQEVDVPVRKLRDVHMLKMMANENLHEFKTSAAVNNETVLTAKQFLDSEIRKYSTVKEFQSKCDASITLLIDKESGFQKIKSEGGVGRRVICSFLGKNYPPWRVQEALDTIKDAAAKEIDRKAVEGAGEVKKAQETRKALKKHNIPLSQQKKVVKELKKEGIGKRGIDKAVKQIAKKKGWTKPETKTKKKHIPDMMEFMEEHTGMMYKVRLKLEQLTPHLHEADQGRIFNSWFREFGNLEEAMKKVPNKSQVASKMIKNVTSEKKKLSA